MIIKKVTLALALVVGVASCNQGGRQAEIDVAAIIADTTNVNVLYFRIKQRCATCNAVAAVAQRTVETVYAGNEKVRYVEIENSVKANEALIEKYEVMWNVLIIVKGDAVVDITQRAFLNAVNNPQLVENIIIDEVNKRL